MVWGFSVVQHCIDDGGRCIHCMAFWSIAGRLDKGDAVLVSHDLG